MLLLLPSPIHAPSAVAKNIEYIILYSIYTIYYTTKYYDNKPSRKDKQNGVRPIFTTLHQRSRAITYFLELLQRDLRLRNRHCYCNRADSNESNEKHGLGHRAKTKGISDTNPLPLFTIFSLKKCLSKNPNYLIFNLFFEDAATLASSCPVASHPILHNKDERTNTRTLVIL